MCYLWDNYIQLYSDAQIFLMGVGNAHYAVKALLTYRGKCPGTENKAFGHTGFKSGTANVKARAH